MIIIIDSNRFARNQYRIDTKNKTFCKPWAAGHEVKEPRHHEFQLKAVNFKVGEQFAFGSFAGQIDSIKILSDPPVINETTQHGSIYVYAGPRNWA